MPIILGLGLAALASGCHLPRHSHPTAQPQMMYIRQNSPNTTNITINNSQGPRTPYPQIGYDDRFNVAFKSWADNGDGRVTSNELVGATRMVDLSDWGTGVVNFGTRIVGGDLGMPVQFSLRDGWGRYIVSPTKVGGISGPDQVFKGSVSKSRLKPGVYAVRFNVGGSQEEYQIGVKP